MRVKLIIEYNGTGFCGWQRQADLISVQETLERSISLVLGKKEVIGLFGAGRTDAGVHALGQVAHFDILSDDLVSRWEHDIDNIPKAINSYLVDQDVVVLHAEIVPSDFHARFSAKMRYYEYLIYNRRERSAFLKDRAWHLPQKIDVKKMIEASRYFIGHHNLDSFRSSQCNAQNPMRTISSIDIQRLDKMVKISIASKSFLHNQVRIMVGTLVRVGENKMQSEDIRTLLMIQDRTRAGPTAPPHGLYFKKVSYDIEEKLAEGSF
ncbi:MAG: tRNA pseudouridine(38-40) synthase TruA [Holosporales bacterium]|jgi:tRNA pseudouridine38-40 synthase|nr:tRNA pseudouridine(38-40) synthase TruA [Holosporales bacterium]